jgi:hypothetical protein
MRGHVLDVVDIVVMDQTEVWLTSPAGGMGDGQTVRFDRGHVAVVDVAEVERREVGGSRRKPSRPGTRQDQWIPYVTENKYTAVRCHIIPIPTTPAQNTTGMREWYPEKKKKNKKTQK